nr:hypothetical protein [Candidatus Freyarchaeota archaeon]
TKRKKRTTRKNSKNKRKGKIVKKTKVYQNRSEIVEETSVTNQSESRTLQSKKYVTIRKKLCNGH